MQTKHLKFTAAALALLLGTASARADGSGDVVAAEILPGWQTDQGTYMAGLHIKLAPGWKTYWRAPGEAGIPPRFDWAGSENTATVRVHWPTPKVFSSNGMRTIGYVDDVVLPIELTPTDPGQPMELRGHVELGVCHDICMPADLRLSERLPAKGEPGPIRAALAAQPMSAREARVGEVHCQIQPITDGLRLTAEIDVPPLGHQEAAVFELPDPSVWVSETEMARKGGRLVASSDLVPVTGAPFVLDRSAVRITILGEQKAIDIHGCTGR